MKSIITKLLFVSICQFKIKYGISFGLFGILNPRQVQPPCSLSSMLSSLFQSTSSSSVTIKEEVLNLNNNATRSSSSRIVKQGLLFSSFSEGIQNSKKPKEIFQNMLTNCLWKDYIQEKENALEASVKYSPCNGPDITLLQELEESDDPSSIEIEEKLQVLTKGRENEVQLRVLYIPTACYAIRKDSLKSPGKQRQRARADGKKRRNVIIQTIDELLLHKVDILGITLDLDDGSLKQPSSTSDSSLDGSSTLFPKNGIDALQSWKPHVIYIEGGNTFWLYHCIQKGNWETLIQNACSSRKTIYCGKSAGAILAGSSMDTACWKEWDDPSVVPGKEQYDDWKHVKGLGLVGDTTFVFPHMSPEWDGLVEGKVRDMEGGMELITLKEDEVFCVMDHEEDGNRPLSFKIE